MKIQLLRHATLLVLINGKKILVDPMLGAARSMTTIENSSNAKRNPLVELTVTLEIIKDIHGVLLTHTHRDHWDATAIEQLPSTMTIFCPPEEEETLKKLGFKKIHPIKERISWEGISIERTGGQHGTGEIGMQMGPVSGYILQVVGEPSLYIAGDTIYCEDVSSVLARYQPDVVVVNAGGARFNTGDPITMTAKDVVEVCRKGSKSKILAVHMEAINHCLMTRTDLRTHLEGEGIRDQVIIPMDGEELFFS